MGRNLNPSHLASYKGMFILSLLLLRPWARGAKCEGFSWRNGFHASFLNWRSTIKARISITVQKKKNAARILGNFPNDTVRV